MPSASAQGRRWCFTLFKDYKDIGSTLLEDIKSKCNEQKGPIIKLVYQEETCPETNKMHIQGYAVFSTPKRQKAVKDILNSPSAHVELANADDHCNLIYCTKTETQTGSFQFKFGDFTKSQGKRNDFASLIQAIKENKTMEDINETHTEHIIKYHKGIHASRLLQIAKSCPATFPRQTIVIWGKSGSGKSLWAREFGAFKNYRIYSKPPGRADSPQWFDGYDGEEILLLDDFEPNQVPYRELLVWLDVYKHRVQIKGSMTLALWKTVIITSNSDPDDWYIGPLSRLERQPLDRRLDNILHAPLTGWCTEKFDIKDEYKQREPASVMKDTSPPLLPPLTLERETLDMSLTTTEEIQEIEETWTKNFFK